jgi:hypothetical protein
MFLLELGDLGRRLIELSLSLISMTLCIRNPFLNLDNGVRLLLQFLDIAMRLGCASARGKKAQWTHEYFCSDMRPGELALELFNFLLLIASSLCLLPPGFGFRNLSFQISQGFPLLHEQLLGSGNVEAAHIVFVGKLLQLRSAQEKLECAVRHLKCNNFQRFIHLVLVTSGRSAQELPRRICNKVSQWVYKRKARAPWVRTFIGLST